MSMAFLAPALLPGRTLSNSDDLYFQPPFVTAKPAALRTPSNPELGDAILQLQPFVRHTREVLPHIPLWNPGIMGGRPFLANDQAAVFGPYSVPSYVLPFWASLGWVGVLKLWVAAFGTFLLGRALGMRFAGALLAGVVFALNLRMVTWLSYPHMSVWTFIPWMLFLTERLIRGPTRLLGAGLATVVALQFLSGHAESSFHALLATGAFLLLRLWQARRAGDAVPLRRVLPAFGLAVLGGAALAAVALVPFLELLLHSADLHDRGGAAIDIALPHEDAIGFVLPDWWGRPTQTPIKLFVIDRAVYFGALPLILASLALILRPRLERVAIALFGLGTACVVLGVPPFTQVVTHLPVFRSGHNSRLIVLTMLAGALLAGWGFDDLAGRVDSPRRRKAALGVGAALLAGPLLLGAALQHPTPHALWGGLKIAWLFHHPPGEFRLPLGAAVIRMSSLILWLTFAGGGLLLIVLRLRGRLGPAPFAALGVLLVVADLFRAGMGFNPAIPTKYAEPPATGAIRYLQRQGTAARAVATEEIPQNVLSFQFGLQEARGYDFPIIQRYDRVWRRTIAPEFSSVAGGFAQVALELRSVRPPALRMLRRLGVTHLLRAKALAGAPPADGLTPFPPLREPGLRLAYDGRDARVYRIEGALPRAFVVGRQDEVSDGEAARRAFTSARFDARGVAITEARVAGLPAAPSSGPAGPGGAARIVSYRPERVVVRATSTGRGLVVLSDNWFPGWKATVDGRPAPLVRADYLFRGVPVGPGSHLVEFRYEPASWRIGWVTSLAALLVLALTVLTGVRRRNR